jgi:DNA invertase Pin-like site-specific DNA recombinase
VAGVDRARRQGKRFGRPGVIVDRQKIAAMKANGQSIKSIAEECGIARATVRSILARVAESGAAVPELPA